MEIIDTNVLQVWREFIYLKIWHFYAKNIAESHHQVCRKS